MHSLAHSRPRDAAEADDPYDDTLSVGIDCRPDGITTGGVRYSQDEVELCERYIAAKKLPAWTHISTLLPLARDGALDRYGF